MATLIFKNDNPGDTVTLGPQPSFRVSSNFIRDAAGEIIARYHNHYWEVNQRHFTRYDCPTLVHIRFEDLEGGSGQKYGPFKKFWVADGSVYADGKLACKFMDTTLMWHDHESDTFWPVMNIED